MTTRTDLYRVFGPDGTMLSETVVEVDTTAETNGTTIRGQATAALTANATFLALASPTNAQNAAQVKELTRQINGLIRLAIGRLEAAD